MFRFDSGGRFQVPGRETVIGVFSLGFDPRGGVPRGGVNHFGEGIIKV